MSPPDPGRPASVSLTLPVSREVFAVARAAKLASRRLAAIPAQARNDALLAYACALESREAAILAANAEDLKAAAPLVAAGELSRSLFERLKLDGVKLRGMADGVRAVAALPDPSGRVLARTLLDDGLVLEKVTCPLGVLAVVFEARPDAVTQISALALKSGNAVILKGGREAARSTTVLVETLHDVLRASPVPAEAVGLLAGREEVEELLSLDDLVDLVIPRGSNALVRHVMSRTRIPVLGHAEGVCHLYLDRSADEAMSVALVHDAKLQYPAACNAVETLLVHLEAAPRLLRPVLADLLAAGVALRACPRTRALLPDLPIEPATEDDWRAEYGEPILAVRLVDSLDEAIAHVNTFGSSHTDGIVAEDAGAAERFLAEVDSAGVYHNASTRFADGYRYGFGAEVGISTSKLHARGPVGLEGLVSYKYKLRGSGQVVATYTGESPRPFRHETLPTG